MKKFKTILSKTWLYVVLAASAVAGYLIFIKKQAIEALPRPSLFPEGSKPTKLPPKPEKINWDKVAKADISKIKKSMPASRKALIKSVNVKAKKKKK